MSSLNSTDDKADTMYLYLFYNELQLQKETQHGM